MVCRVHKRNICTSNFSCYTDFKMYRLMEYGLHSSGVGVFVGQASACRAALWNAMDTCCCEPSYMLPSYAPEQSTGCLPWMVWLAKLSVVCYMEEVHYWEGPLSEVPLYTAKNGRVVITTVWLYQFNLWDPCCSNITMHGNQSSCLCRGVHATVKPLYNSHIGPCKTGPYNEVVSLLR